MGGLAKRMPVTVLCFILGTAALIAIPGTSGFFSKEAILDAALEKSPVFFYIGAGVAALTTFYMTRLCLVAFLGKARDHGAEHAKEAGPSMLLPLIILAVMAVIAGYGFIADELVPFAGFHAHGMEIGTPFFVSLGALVIGLLAAVIVYGFGKRSQDPLAGNCISTALRKRLYIDCFYDKVVIGFFQDKLLAGIIEGVDTALIRGILVQGLAWATSRVGKLLSWIQGGSLRGYALVTGLGLVIVVFLFVFYHI